VRAVAASGVPGAVGSTRSEQINTHCCTHTLAHPHWQPAQRQVTQPPSHPASQPATHAPPTHPASYRT
jgi:hypothetical protein